jgi:predicted GNAT family acetyltransferase
MKFDLYKDIKFFYKETYDILMRHESQNIVPLGNIIMGNQGNDTFGWRDTSNWFMATVSDNAGIQLTAVMTPPFNLTLYATDNKINDEALTCLVNEIIRMNIYIPMVMTEKSLAERFAKIYKKSKGLKYSIFKAIRMHEVLKANPKVPMLGALRLAENKDLAFLPYWIEGFNNIWYGTSQYVLTDTERYHYEIASKKLYIMEDNGVPVAMAKITREMQTIFSVGMAYSPPFFQGIGYTISCTAGVIRIGLEKGFKKLVGMTDLANSTMQKYNQKTGASIVCDCLEIKFE